MALLLEVLDWRGTRKELRGGISLLLWIGTGSAVVAVALGLLLANQ